jgi:hypothetical protein
MEGKGEIPCGSRSLGDRGRPSLSRVYAGLAEGGRLRSQNASPESLELHDFEDRSEVRSSKKAF